MITCHCYLLETLEGDSTPATYLPRYCLTVFMVPVDASMHRGNNLWKRITFLTLSTHYSTIYQRLPARKSMLSLRGRNCPEPNNYVHSSGDSIVQHCFEAETATVRRCSPLALSHTVSANVRSKASPLVMDYVLCSRCCGRVAVGTHI